MPLDVGMDGPATCRRLRDDTAPRWVLQDRDTIYDEQARHGSLACITDVSTTSLADRYVERVIDRLVANISIM